MEDDEVEQVEKKQKRGVIYISSVPPGLKPGSFKSLLAQHGEITRTYLQPEDDRKRKRRISLGGSSGLRYVEGWAEYATRKEAKRIAQMLDGSRIGPRKTSRFYDDFWRVKYLSGFPWDMLMEKSRIEKRERDLRLRLELADAKKSDEAFLQSVAKSHRIKKAIENNPKVEEEEEEEEKEEESSNKVEVKTKPKNNKRQLPRQLLPIDKKLRSHHGD